MERGMFYEMSRSALSSPFLCSGADRTNLPDMPVDTTKFLGTARKNKSGLEFRGFLVKNEASFHSIKFLFFRTGRRYGDAL